jgi:hypothetical protein
MSIRPYGTAGADEVYRCDAILRVSFSIDYKHNGSWNVNLSDPRTGKPVEPITQRQMDDAVFQFQELRDIVTFKQLADRRNGRSQAIRDHFSICADKMIEGIEKDEGWEDFMDRITAQPSSALELAVAIKKGEDL